MNKVIVAETGINWNFVYSVIYEDDLILVLKDLGRFHKFDSDRKFDEPINEWIEIFGEFAFVGKNRVKKLVEIERT